MAMQQGPTPTFIPGLGNRYEYSDTPQGRRDLKEALINWYLAAQSLNTAQPLLWLNTWLQLQTPPQGNAPGAILYNCGGINRGIADGTGGFGVDFANQQLYQWFVANRTIADGRLPNQGNVTFTVLHEPTTVWVRPSFQAPGPSRHQQDYYVVYCTATTIQYAQNHLFYSQWDQSIWSQDGQTRVQLTGGMRYNIIVNFHLYVGPPEEAQAQPSPRQNLTLGDFFN